MFKKYSENHCRGRANWLDLLVFAGFLSVIIFGTDAVFGQTLKADANMTLNPLRVQAFNGGLGLQAEQTQSLSNQVATITSIDAGKITTDLNTDFGTLNLVFQREIVDAWSANFTSGCAVDLDIQVTFQNGEMISTLNASDSSAVSVESFGVSKQYKGNGCLHKASGSLRFYIDITNAAAAGTYSGNMTIEVNPVF